MLSNVFNASLSFFAEATAAFSLPLGSINEYGEVRGAKGLVGGGRCG